MDSLPAIESWEPDRHRLHLRARYAQIAPALRSLGGVALVSLLIALYASQAGAGSAGLWMFMPAALITAALLAGLASTPPWRAAGVRFELDAASVRVVTPFGARELALHAISQIDVVHTSKRGDIGHVVFRQHDDTEARSPAIPTGRRVSAGSVGLVSWASVEQIDPQEQLFDGAMTFWFVANPDIIAQRIRAAVLGTAPHSTGPHR